MDWRAAQSRFPSPLFDGVRSALDALAHCTDWPTAADFNALAAGLVNARGVPLRFVEAGVDTAAVHYETCIAETGEIATRPNQWHDMFNALAWLSFPAAKGAINAQHAALLAERGDVEARARSVERDVLTLFD
ncbi:MAG: DUF3025 domain-containing protein, partial [Betaproteobacteria bacterium]|nr:DUF3025 domain-containing protein [Betaproteobacteria bacterium]